MYIYVHPHQINLDPKANRTGGPPSPGKATRITRPQKRYDTFNTAAPVLRPSVMRLSGYQRNGKRTRHGDCLRFGTLNCRTLANDTAIEQLLTANRKSKHRHIGAPGNEISEDQLRQDEERRASHPWRESKRKRTSEGSASSSTSLSSQLSTPSKSSTPGSAFFASTLEIKER
ncbi:unnamed protein product [Caenorhabditis auriculariae]|uniref:Uncharacterized protein n=1 Tax=Caenorhabditis auriculariae TaxID=2777116 RepID=A0A8S1H3C3_9PELO|nr:unnamed protein product [Caenorhabditis auriculariae]